ncbi:MAG: hypothetical protein U0164_19775 [Gemmatimonadaceae bacterium]
MIEEEPLEEAPMLGQPAAEWARDTSRRALDDLFASAKRYRSGEAFAELLDFARRFRFYAPYNAMLLHAQMPGATFVAPAYRWLREYGRRIVPGERPLVILQTMGPVMFVFDVSQTEGGEEAPRLPSLVTSPFAARGADVAGALEWMRLNAERDGVRVHMSDEGSQSAGSIYPAEKGQRIDVVVATKPEVIRKQIPLRYELLLNRRASTATTYATLLHELAHLYCGHLGTPNAKWWPDRRGLSLEVREFEAEAVAALVCARAELDTPADFYLSGYLQSNGEVPEISVELVMKVAGLLEQMGRSRMKLREDRKGG